MTMSLNPQILITLSEDRASVISTTFIEPDSVDRFTQILRDVDYRVDLAKRDNRFWCMFIQWDGYVSETCGFIPHHTIHDVVSVEVEFNLRYPSFFQTIVDRDKEKRRAHLHQLYKIGYA